MPLKSVCGRELAAYVLTTHPPPPVFPTTYCRMDEYIRLMAAMIGVMATPGVLLHVLALDFKTSAQEEARDNSRNTQCTLLRLIVGNACRRKGNGKVESWVGWIKRVKYRAEKP